MSQQAVSPERRACAESSGLARARRCGWRRLSAGTRRRPELGERWRVFPFTSRTVIDGPPRESHRARTVPPSADFDRRGDGHRPAQDLLFGQYQGAARLFVRGLRCARRDGGHGRSHAGASRRDAAVGARGARGVRTGAGRCGAGERSVSRRHALAGYHGGGSGVYGRREAVLLFGEPRASRRCGRHEPGIDAAGSRNLSGGVADSTGADPARRQDRSRLAGPGAGECADSGGARRRLDGAVDVDPARRGAAAGTGGASTASRWSCATCTGCRITANA